MPRNITAAQKSACDFSHDTENTNKLFSPDLKVETKISDTFL